MALSNILNRERRKYSIPGVCSILRLVLVQEPISEGGVVEGDHLLRRGGKKRRQDRETLVQFGLHRGRRRATGIEHGEKGVPL